MTTPKPQVDLDFLHAALKSLGSERPPRKREVVQRALQNIVTTVIAVLITLAVIGGLVILLELIVKAIRSLV